jgi:hypothetical protein
VRPARGSDDAHAEAPALRLAAGLFGGFALLALVNAAAIAVAVPLPAAGVTLRLLHHLFDAAETLGLGLVVAAVAGAFVKLVPLPRLAMYAVAFAVAVAVVYAVIGEYLLLQAAHAWNGRLELPIYINYFLLVGAALVCAPGVTEPFANPPRQRLIAVGFAAGIMVADQIPLRDDYAGIHGLIALGAVLFASPVVAPIVLAVGRRMMRRRAGVAGLVALAMFSVAGVVVPPSNATRLELFRQPCAVAPWVLATAIWRTPALHAPAVAPPSPWTLDRSRDPAVRPTVPSLLPRDAVVVLITIDALRADVVEDPANDAMFPTLAQLKRDGVVFTHASAPGSQTPGSLTTMFSGLYYSQQRWADYGEGGDRFPYPADDPAPRFPEILSNHGVATVQAAGYVFLAGNFGVARGFADETMLGHTKGAAVASRLVAVLLDRLEHAGDGPAFLYAHLAEPHAPYKMGPPGDDFHHYLSAVAIADNQLGRVLALLQQRFGKRWALLVSADHGEAFGDHQTFEHAKTLYEELVHVPLLALSPLFKPHRVDARVGLVDLGPTLLDLFQLDTPATFNGQSLVPFLAGRTATLTRPLFAEGRLRKALTRSDGLKIIEDPRRKVVEAYDLAADPGETRNLFDLEPARSDAALAELRAFFAARTLRDGGYEPPYKP